MNLRLFRNSAAMVFGTLLLASTLLAQTHAAAPQSPYGGVTVEEMVARVNDQIITSSDYERAMKELDEAARQHGASMQEISAAHRDLLRNLIDQQLWLSKGKELNITGETELVNKLNEIRKQYNLESIEDLEKAAKEQGVSFEDFKANIRNQIITQLVMRQEVGKRVQFTPGEAQRYFEQHKQEYAQQESVSLAEILVSTGTAAPGPGGAPPDDPAALAAAQAKANDIEAKLKAGGDFSQLARSFSDGPTAAEGGDLGQFRRGALAKVLEDKTFALKAGEYTEPIRTRQGFVILKVTEHIPGGIPQYKDVEQQVEENFYMARMEPAMRSYLTTMREQAFIDIKPGYTDTGASVKQTKPVFSAYVPPAPKKKKKVERTRYRENTHNYRQKPSKAFSAEAPAEPAPAPAKPAKKSKKGAGVEQASTMKPGKKEKIRLGQAPTKTLPSAPQSKTEDAGGGAGQQTASSGQEPVNPLEPARPTKKTRYSDRARQEKQAKQPKGKGLKPDALAPAAPDAAEVADRQTQSGPLGLAGDTSNQKKKKSTTTGDKIRLTNKKKKTETPAQDTGGVPQSPAPQPKQ
ncbi:MAG: peptidylprolyl isomerase [Terracidiphilus sp.]|jgi:peptidyl-prolyl cis-trans isomerase SurA